VHVVTCGDGRIEQKFPSYVVPDLGRPHFGKLGYLVKVPGAGQFIGSLTPDVAHARHATSYGLLAAVARVHPLVVNRLVCSDPSQATKTMRMTLPAERSRDRVMRL
jgi:hypothetical protein